MPIEPGAQRQVRPDWHAALAYALIGERVPVTPAATPDAARLLAELDELGWSKTRLAAAAGQARRVPDELMAGLGFAQFWAVLTQLRGVLGATSVVEHAPTRRTELDDEDRRLSADRPPHW